MKLPDSVRVTGDSESAAAHGNHMSEKSALLTLNVAHDVAKCLGRWHN